MTSKERDELLLMSKNLYLPSDGIACDHWELLNRIILALPVEAAPEPAGPTPAQPEAMPKCVADLIVAVEQWEDPPVPPISTHIAAVAFILGRWYGRAERAGDYSRGFRNGAIGAAMAHSFMDCIVQPCPPDCPDCAEMRGDDAALDQEMKL